MTVLRFHLYPSVYCNLMISTSILSTEIALILVLQEGAKLNVPEGISLSRRALSYQAYMAYIQAKYNDPSVNLEIPLDFWSSEYNSKDAVRDRLAGLVTSSIHDESLEVDEDEDE